MIAKNYLSTTLEPVRFTETGTDILYHLDEYHLQDIPVVEGDNLKGSVSESDVFAMQDPDVSLKKQKFAFNRQFVYEYQHIFDVIKIMTSAKLTVLPVLNADEKYMGCILQSSILGGLAELMTLEAPGAIIVLEVNQNDYVLSEIARIVESQDGKIMNLFVSPDKNSTKMDVTIKINSIEIQALMQTFNRYNYIIKATYTEDEKLYDDLRDRYDSLMKYLSI